MLMVFNRWQRFGFACVNFGTPMSLRDFCRDHDLRFAAMTRDARFPVVDDICREIMHSIEKLIPVLPISLVAAVLLENQERWLSEFDIKSHAHHLLERLQGLGAPILVPTRGLEVAVTTAFHMLRIRRMLEESEGRFRADPASHDILQYYANAIAYLVVSVPDAKPRTVRVNVTVPELTLKQIDAAAKKRGMSRSSFLVHAAQNAIQSIQSNASE